MVIGQSSVWIEGTSPLLVASPSIPIHIGIAPSRLSET
jgi:hypothetical protein